ncbi:transcription factor Ouib [Drosophila serrata]|uniref:transcription factor Ouib n=1 Tax=Drosophila serrata TaxID=7274 RepID=UPI000A1D1055|nr:transcription factor Ouib [Drosophila serrata]KAH8375825.1 hypothetical protein KR200_000518 [Drosophila serrata]
MPEFMLCRICLTDHINADTMSPLFDDEDEECRELVRKLEEVVSIKLVPLQDIPSMLCLNCLEKLTNAHEFRRLCQVALTTNVVKAELKVEPTDEVPHIVAEYIYEATSDFINTEEEGMELEAMLEERLEDGIAESEHPYEMDAAADELDENELLERQGSDSDYNPGEHCHKTKVRKTRHSKRGRGRPRNSAGGLTQGNTQDMASVPLSCKSSPEESTTNIMCEICGNIYSKRAALNIHMRRHLAEKPFECEICSKTFAGPSELNRHIRVHTGEKPFMCKYCNRSFADRSSNIRHERTHTNERPFTCPTCGKAFSYSNVLKNHMLTHTGEKPFLCRPCNKNFSRKHQLEQHIGTMTHQLTMRKHQNNDAMLCTSP